MVCHTRHANPKSRTRSSFLSLFTLTLLSTSLLSYSLGAVNGARTVSFPPTRPMYLTLNNNAEITVPTTINAFSVSSFYRTNNRWYFGDDYITTTTDLTLTKWFSQNWLNYTVASSGTQTIYNGSKPHVYIDGILRAENNGWTYSAGAVTITAATTNASLYYGALTFTKPSLIQILFQVFSIASKPVWYTFIVDINAAYFLGGFATFVLMALGIVCLMARNTKYATLFIISGVVLAVLLGFGFILSNTIPRNIQP